MALARAVVIEPQLLLFDEPLSNLDAKLRVSMRAEIRQLQQRLGITTLYVTHDQVEALAISDRVVVMDKGVIEQSGTPEEIFSQPATPFVADFMGFSNHFGAEVLAVEGDEMMLQADGLQLRAKTALTAVSSKRVHVYFRSETAMLSETAVANSIPGTIQHRTFQGISHEYQVETTFGPFIIHQTMPRLELGPIHLVLDPENLIILEATS